MCVVLSGLHYFSFTCDKKKRGKNEMQCSPQACFAQLPLLIQCSKSSGHYTLASDGHFEVIAYKIRSMSSTSTT